MQAYLPHAHSVDVNKKYRLTLKKLFYCFLYFSNFLKNIIIELNTERLDLMFGK